MAAQCSALSRLRFPVSSQNHVKNHVRCVKAQARLSAAQRELAEMKTEDNVPTARTIEWASPLTIKSILKYPHPKLRAPNARVGVFGEPLRKLVAEMFEVMYQDDGIGLAAPQVGVNLRLMVFNEEGVRGEGEELAFVNPVIIGYSTSTDVFEEGCLSFPKVLGSVQRPTGIRIKYQDLDGKTQKAAVSGFGARVFQHEYDHLQGQLFHDRFDAPTLQRNRSALVRLEEEFLAANPGVPIQRIA